MNTEAHFIKSCFSQIISLSVDDVYEIGDSVPIPRFTKQDMLKLLSEVQEILVNNKAVKYINGDVFIIGDLHGNIYDLFKIFARSGYPPDSKYVFLGDYVDRGYRDLEVMIFLFALKVLYPDHITLLRGNHENANINRYYGFYQHIMDSYDDESIWEQFNTSFSYLPIAAVVNNELFCVHGGISPKTTTISKLAEMVLPIVDDPIITDLTWSDPTNYHQSFTLSQRGKGYLFGIFAVQQFLQKNNLKKIIRSHECVDGYQVLHGNTVITIFSCSNYSNSDNNGSYVHVDQHGKLDYILLMRCTRDIDHDVIFYDALKESKNPKDTGAVLKSQSKLIIRPTLQSRKGRFMPARHNSYMSIPMP